MSSAEARRMSASVGTFVATLPAILADLSGGEGGEEPTRFSFGHQFFGKEYEASEMMAGSRKRRRAK